MRRRKVAPNPNPINIPVPVAVVNDGYHTTATNEPSSVSIHLLQWKIV